MKIRTYYFFIKFNYLLLFLDSFLISCAIILSTNLITNPLKNKLKKQWQWLK
jgi:hypothetical protein